ncbi:MAG: glycosyltransferase family 2 protein [Candidatus Omnitrophota bacterium]|nr:glycosyltransferase family 2 protein [Candidatus Omnitrophota bacterium]
MGHIPVSVAIIAKNEEENIARCLASVKWADEAIVVDGFSTDRTVEIARSSGAKVIQRRFTGSFADDRNAGQDSAKNDWVLHLDADDVVTKDFAARMEETLSKGESVVVYKFRRKNFFLSHAMDHGGFHHYIPNLVDKRHVRYEGVVHEVPVYKGNMGQIEADIEHYPFGSISQFIVRQNRYTDISSKELLKKEGILPEAKIKSNMILKSLKMFWKSYVKKQGYKEGMYGLAFAVLFAWIHFLKWAKYWELVRKKG